MLRATIVSVNEENDKNLIKFIANTVETMRDQMVTKEELAAVKDQMATKMDLGRLETTMHGEFEQVHLRLNSIDRSLTTRIGQVESEISRLRSVVCLLVKDKPDMLRLLGQPTHGESSSPG